MLLALLFTVNPAISWPTQLAIFMPVGVAGVYPQRNLTFLWGVLQCPAEFSWLDLAFSGSFSISASSEGIHIMTFSMTAVFSEQITFTNRYFSFTRYF